MIAYGSTWVNGYGVRSRQRALWEASRSNPPNSSSMGSPSIFQRRLTAGFPVWHLGRNILARDLAPSVSYGLLIQLLGLFLLLAPRRPDSLAVGGSVLGLQEGFEEVKGYGQDDGRVLLRGDL